MTDTKIQWADKVWNPVTGCSPVSEGCDHCYARRMANRLKGRYGYPADEQFHLTFHPDRLEDLSRWKKARRVFVCSMSDLFHEDLSWDNRARIFRAMREAKQHTYLLLTKRPHIAAHYDWFDHEPNWWLGITAENQKTYDKRAPILSKMKCAHRWISFEPLLGSIDIEALDWRCDWAVVGGETGLGARPMHPDWVRSVRDQCQTANIPYFFKNWGEYAPTKAIPIRGKYTGGGIFLKPDGSYGCQGDWWDGRAVAMDKMGKKAARRLLDGRTWDEIPK
jgi:protein gp37